MKWLFKDGSTVTECTSFPYAYRSMWNAMRKGVEKGRKADEVVKTMSIVSPIKDRNGDTKVYSYAAATAMAQAQGLLGVDGQINSREFRR
jgi:hypothetical protein